MRINMDLRNCDCMELMAEFPDNYFELAIVDPPYGIGFDGWEIPEKMQKRKNGTQGFTSRKQFEKKDWDGSVPDSGYFEELFRVSKNQIIWGGNYFNLPPTKCIICWDKKQNFKMFSAWEMAWTSFKSTASIFRFDNKGFMNPEGSKIHPTQKPVALYKWLLQNYAKAGDKILDTHLGSMSSVIACYDEKFDITGSELDPDYFKAGMERVKKHTSQVRLDDLI